MAKLIVDVVLAEYTAWVNGVLAACVPVIGFVLSGCSNSPPAGQRAEIAAVPPPPRAAVPPAPRPSFSTPGTIQCQATSCDLATEVCCVIGHANNDPVGHCVPRPADGAADEQPCCPNAVPGYCGNESLTTERYCDETADCPSGTQCCSQSELEGDIASHACGTSCYAEVCLPGSVCANGNACSVEPGRSSGECPLQLRPAQCGSVQCNKGEACCWDPETARSRCSSQCEGEDELKFECTSPNQCGTHPCHDHVGSRTYLCGGEGFFGSILCETVADCPTYLSSLGTGPGAPTVQGCEHSSRMPPNAKGCVYGPQD